MERCLEVVVGGTHKTRIVTQETLDRRRVSVSDGLEDCGCAIHGSPRRKSLVTRRKNIIIDRPGAAILSSSNPGSGSVCPGSGEFTSPRGGVKPPLHQIYYPDP